MRFQNNNLTTQKLKNTIQSKACKTNNRTKKKKKIETEEKEKFKSKPERNLVY